METLNKVLFASAFVLILFYLFDILSLKDKRITIKQSPKTDISFGKKETYIIIALTFIGVLARVYKFGSLPFAINQDEAMAAVDAKALADYATDRFGTFLPAHLFGWGYGQMSALLSYFMVPFIKIFGLNTTAVRLPSLLISFAGMAAVYLFARELINKHFALIALFFTSICPWHFIQSRWSIDCNLFPHLFLLGLMCLALGLKNKKFIYISMGFFALCMYSYGLSFFMVPFFLIAASLILLQGKLIKPVDILICAVIYLLISFPIYGTMIINAFKWDTVKLPFVTMPYFKDSVRMNDLIFYSTEPFKQFYANLKTLIGVAFIQKEDLIWNSIGAFGTIYKFTTPFVLLGIFVIIYKCKYEEDAKRKILYRIFTAYCTSAFVLGTLVNGVNVNRINIIFYSHILLAAIGVISIFKWAGKVKPVVIVCYAVLSAVFFSTYLNDYQNMIGSSFYGDFINALEYAKTCDADRYYITPDTQYQGSANVSEILTLYAMDVDSKFFQSSDYNNKFHYVNPDTDLTVTKDGKTVYVIRSSETGNYDLEGRSVKAFGDYTVFT